jgi:hypothetical protein
MARDYLAIPATSVPSEEKFIIGSKVAVTTRSELSPESITMLVCMKDWYRERNPPLKVQTQFSKPPLPRSLTLK